jgi:drug/metabolite transporter (DMT)-like permease
MRAIRDVGATRASVVVATAPHAAVAIAVVALGEPLRPTLLAGALLVVLGGAALASERTRPSGFRTVGLAFSAGCAVMVAARDNAVRWLADDAPGSPFVAGAAALGGGTAFLLAYLVATRGPAALAAFDGGRALVPFLPAGVLYGLSYVSLFEAFERGRVTVVSPLVATESLWALGFAVLLLGRSERVGPRVVAGGVLVVAGAALIGAFR